MTTRNNERNRVDVRKNIRQMLNTNIYDLNLLPTIDNYDLKWVRMSVRGEIDASNIARMTQLGWTPVLFSELKKLADSQNVSISHLTSKEFNGTAGAICTSDMVLMMRPSEFGDDEREYYREQIASQESAIEQGYNNSLPSGFRPLNKALIDD